MIDRLTPSRLRSALGALCLASTVACGTPTMPARVPTEVAAPEGTRHEQGLFDGVGQTPLYWQTWQPTSAKKRGALVVMHGLKDHSSRYAELATRLNRAGFSVWAFDLRGHGSSAGPRVGLEWWEDYTNDLDIFLTRVQAAEGALPVFVFGHSMGGAIVTSHFLRFHPDVAGVVLSGAALHPGVSGAKMAVTDLTSQLAPELDVFNLDLDLFSRDPKVVADAKADPLVYQGSATARMAAELLRGIDELDQHLEDVTAPLLILHGKRDEVTPPAGSQALYDRSKSADRTLTLYGNMVHDLWHEPEKDAVTTDLVRWLERHTRP